jgi:hypothetical protein
MGCVWKKGWADLLELAPFAHLDAKMQRNRNIPPPRARNTNMEERDQIKVGGWVGASLPGLPAPP